MDTIQEILNASSVQDLFGTDNVRVARTKYRRMMRTVHPDMFVDTHDKKVAQEAFSKLTLFWETLNGHGKRKVSDFSNVDYTVVKTKKHEYKITPLRENPVFQVSLGEYDAGFKQAEVYIAKNVNDSDLVDNAVAALKKIDSEVPADFRVFFPTLIEKFNYVDTQKVSHPAYSLEYFSDFYTISEILQKYPNGLPPRQVAWIFRRMLVSVGNAHDLGLLHGAAGPDAFFVHPAYHGVVLNNWEYSQPLGDSLIAIPESLRSWYPDEVFQKKAMDHRLDIAFVAKTGEKLLGTHDFKPFKAFFKGCQLSSVPSAADLLGEFDQLMDNLFGPRKYVTFEM